MPRLYKRVPGSRTYTAYSQRTLDSAIAAIRSGKLTQRQATAHYGIPRSTLKNKLKGKHTKKYGGQTALSEEEEETFTKYCVTMSTFGFPIDTWDLRCIVQCYLNRQGRVIRQFRNNFPGKEWTMSFLKRHQELSVRFASNIKRKRAEISADSVNAFFDNLAVELVDIPPSNIWNYDETNLTDDPGTKRVITKRGAKYPERVINSTKTATSLMFCGNAIGEVIPPYVVYKAESMWSTWTENGPPGARYNRSKSGWFDSFCFEDWFRSLLLPRLKKSHSGRHILIGDNLSSHINVAVLSLCEENGVSFVALPPNSTHLLQPLDVAYFRPMKMAWKKILTDWKTKGRGRKAPSLPKDEFPKLLKTLMEKLDTSGQQNLVSGFRKTGIWPVDTQQVLARLPDQSIADNSDGIKEHVSESFLEHLKAARGDGEGNCRRKRQKVSVIPGKSVSADDVHHGLAKKAASSSKSEKLSSETTRMTDAALSSMIEHDDVSGIEEERNVDLDVEPSDGDDEPGWDDSSVSTNSDSFAAAADADTRGADAKHVTKKMDVGSFVIVDYEGVKYPGVVANLKKSGAEVATMMRSGVNWKWPSRRDQIVYSKDEILDVIKEPEKLGRRGVLKVPEMDKYL